MRTLPAVQKRLEYKNRMGIAIAPSEQSLQIYNLPRFTLSLSTEHHTNNIDFSKVELKHLLTVLSDYFETEMESDESHVVDEMFHDARFDNSTITF